MTDPPRLIEDDEALGEGARRVLDAGVRLRPPPGATDRLWTLLLATLPPIVPPPTGGGPSSPFGGPAPAGSGSVAGSAANGAGGSGLGGGLGAASHPGATVVAGGGLVLSATTLGKTAVVGFSVGLTSLFVGGLGSRLATSVAPSRDVASSTTPAAKSVTLAQRPRLAVTGDGLAHSPPDEATLSLPSATKDRLAREARLVETARGLLRARDPAGALSLLRTNAEAFPPGGLEQERAVLEVEALVALGHGEEAEARGKTILERYPRSPHAARLREALR
ncbi:MAG: tetratricopeptide repeat protein [Polyangiaceae bacterium]|nr:tetratricopeptide repeat protein [Polyangiaceae bacterium]